MTSVVSPPSEAEREALLALAFDDGERVEARRRALSELVARAPDSAEAGQALGTLRVDSERRMVIAALVEGGDVKGLAAHALRPVRELERDEALRYLVERFADHPVTLDVVDAWLASSHIRPGDILRVLGERWSRTPSELAERLLLHVFADPDPSRRLRVAAALGEVGSATRSVPMLAPHCSPAR